jgi:hypothetical protein
MKARLAASGAFGKILATLAITAGMTMYGCSKHAERSLAAKEQFKSVGETDAKLLKPKGRAARKGFGAPKSIKGKLADLEKEKTTEL